MGLTFAQPAIAQARFVVDVAGSSVPKNGAVAILPGGVGTMGISGASGDCSNGVTNPSMRNSSGRPFQSLAPQDDGTGNINAFDHRFDVRCWKDSGRALYFVDVETGLLIKKIYKTSGSTGSYIFPSPIISTPSIFQSDIGTLASRAFVTDADGVIWRIDLSANDQDATHPMAGWTARPFHDIFWYPQIPARRPQASSATTRPS